MWSLRFLRSAFFLGCFFQQRYRLAATARLVILCPLHGLFLPVDDVSCRMTGAFAVCCVVCSNIESALGSSCVVW